MKRYVLIAGALGIASLIGGLVTGGRAAQAVAPTSSVEPQITGAPVVGRTLRASRGTWTGSPTGYAYQWVRCPSAGSQPNGSDCAAIAGATTSAYVVGGTDVGRRLRVRVTATNADGGTTAASNATAVVQRAGAIVNTALPTIAGIPVVASTLTAAPGTWTGESLTFGYSWRRCDSDGATCDPITGATERTYTVQQVDVGNRLRVRVVARNLDRSSSATSVATDRVRLAGQAGPDGCPSGSGTIPVGSLTSPARLLVDRQSLTPSVVTRGTDSISLRIHVSACGGRPVQDALVYSTAVPYNQFSTDERPTDSSGWTTLDLRRLGAFPASNAQQLLVVFVRARKAGEGALGGVSSRRLVSFPVRLRG